MVGRLREGSSSIQSALLKRIFEEAATLNGQINLGVRVLRPGKVLRH